MTKRNVIVADIDGCCICCGHRVPFLLEPTLDRYHAAHVNDRPIEQGVAVYRKFLQDPDYRFLFVTGRVEAARHYTLQQLREWVDPSITDAQLLMRPDALDDETMHDAEFKPYILDQNGVTPQDIFLVFEDRDSVVRMWRTLGVVCYQTAFGDW